MAASENLETLVGVCFAVVQTCQSVDGFFNWKRKYRWFDAGICDAEKNSTNKYLDDGPDRLILK